MFSGSIPALLTPFRDGNVDEAGFQAFVEWQISEGSHGLVPVGTTGESPTLSHAEHMRVVDLCIEAAAGRVPVIAGAGSNSTAEAVELAQHAQQAGADAVLVVTPYYNKPSQDGLFAHYQEVARSVDLPIIVYNVPPRTAVDISVETIARLHAACPNIMGVKDATADLSRPLSMRHAVGREFCQLSGEDATALPFLACGGVGCISVTANVAPALCAQVQNAWRDGDVATATELTDRLLPLHKALFLEPSPQPVKYAAELLGKAPAATRLPLVPVSAETQRAVREAMVFAGLLN